MVRKTKTELETPVVKAPENTVEAVEVVVTTKKRGRKPKVKEEKTPKTPSKYAQYIKENYHLSRDLPVKERFKHLAKLWKEEKGKEGTK
jgi:hypothetical protein